MTTPTLVSGVLHEPGCMSRILQVARSRREYKSLRDALERSQWRLKHVVTCAQARAFLKRHTVPVVIVSADLADGDWKDLFRLVEELPNPPSLIVSSRLADERLWAEVLNVGGYDVLKTPFVGDEALRVTTAAWRWWKRTWARTVNGHASQASAGSDAAIRLPAFNPSGAGG